MMRLMLLATLGFLVFVLPANCIRPYHSWDTVGSMTFFHSCNESGLFSEAALDTIEKFPMVTIEKGQGFNNDNCASFNATFPCAEKKIVAQCKAVKERNRSIATVFYMNSVLDWQFYHMHDDLIQHPEWQIRDSWTGQPAKLSGDKHFNPPKGGLLGFNHANSDMRDYWKAVCINATQTGFVDGCFSDSSQNATHGTEKHLNASDDQAFEAGKIQTMSEMTQFFGGAAGKPYEGSTGVLIGKKPDQQGINSFQIEFFGPDEGSIQELMQGVSLGYLVQAHVGDGSIPSTKGCNDIEAMTDVLAAFLIGAGDNSYFGTGPWITTGLEDIQQRWCPPLYEKPLGKPVGNATLTGTEYKRSFASGTTVTFDTKTNKGAINWGSV
eukprot:m.277406 g.277406  ORF g.277406 m.277406 type:complete len:381 (-) comp16306_c0_seq14:759-1901(-)